MGYRGLLLTLLVLTIVPWNAAADCMSANDCPQCGIDGAVLTKKAVNSPYNGRQTLTCEYLGKDNNGDLVKLVITCYENTSIAQQYTNFYAGTGKNPEPNEYERFYGRTRHPCVSGGFSQGPGDLMIGSFGCGNSTGSGRFVSSISIGSGYVEHLSTDTAAEQTRKYKAATAVVVDRIEQYQKCLANFNPKGEPDTIAGEKTLHGNITATKIPYGIEYPLEHAKLELFDISTDRDRRLVGETTTDGDGKYQFREALEKGRKYELAIHLTYYDTKEYFSLYMGTAESESNKVILSTEFTYADEKDLEQNIDLDSLWSALGIGGENPYGILYVHTAEALEFYRDQLHEDIHLNLPLKIVAFIPEGVFKKDIKAMYYIDPAARLSMIAIGPEESGPHSEYRPMNREFHEFSHYLMTNVYGGYLGSRVKSDIPIINHDGYVNPSTSDSWQEGFAEFMAVVIGEHYGYSCFGQDNFLSLDSSHKAWDYQGKAEEYAVAGVLYDLYDGKSQDEACIGTTTYLAGRIANSPQPDPEKKELAMAVFTMMTRPRASWAGEYQDDDGISLSLPEIWSVLKDRHPDFTSVYQGFVQRYPSQKADIDAVFRDHGFFADTSTGNATYDEGEPFRDADGNAVYDPGEYFIDSGQYLLDSSFPDSRVDKPHYDRPTDLVGTATNYQRPWRLTTQKLPGHFIKVNNEVPFYTFVVEFPGTYRSGYSALVRNYKGLIYVPVPPDSGARITVSALGVTTGNPLVFTSDQFHEKYMASVKQGTYTSHDFRVTGPVPAPPVTPDFSKGGFAGKQSDGLLSAKGPLFDTLLGRTTGRAPIIVPVIIAIISFAIVAYVLKKEL